MHRSCCSWLCWELVLPQMGRLLRPCFPPQEELAQPQRLPLHRRNAWICRPLVSSKVGKPQRLLCGSTACLWPQASLELLPPPQTQHNRACPCLAGMLSCSERKAAGECEQPITAGFCAQTCGRCPTAPAPQPEAAKSLEGGVVQGTVSPPTPEPAASASTPPAVEAAAPMAEQATQHVAPSRWEPLSPLREQAMAAVPSTESPQTDSTGALTDNTMAAAAPSTEGMASPEGMWTMAAPAQEPEASPRLEGGTVEGAISPALTPAPTAENLSTESMEAMTAPVPSIEMEGSSGLEGGVVRGSVPPPTPSPSPAANCNAVTSLFAGSGACATATADSCPSGCKEALTGAKRQGECDGEIVKTFNK